MITPNVFSKPGFLFPQQLDPGVVGVSGVSGVSGVASAGIPPRGAVPRAPPRSLAPLASPGGPGHAPSGPFVRSSGGRSRTPLRCSGPTRLRRCCRARNRDVAPGRRSHVGLRDLRRYLLAGFGGSGALPLPGNRRLGLGLARIHVALPAAGRRGRARGGRGELLLRLLLRPAPGPRGPGSRGM